MKCVASEDIRIPGKGSKQRAEIRRKKAHVVTKSYVLHWMFSNCACADCCVTSKARRAGNGLASSRSPVTSIDARCVLSQSTFSLPSSPTRHPLSGALTRHRPIRDRFVDSPGCSLGVVLISQRPYATSQTDEKPDKSTISPILLTSSYTHAYSFFLSFPLCLSPSVARARARNLALPLAFCLSLAPSAATKVNNLEPCRHSYRPRARNPYRVSARSLEFAEPLAKMTIFLGHSA